MNKQKLIRITVLIFIITFVAMNVIAAFHAYKFTHLSKEKVVRTKNPDELTFLEKLNTLFFGINNPKPINEVKPSQDYETVFIEGNECWWLKQESSLGTILIFHGYTGVKSQELEKAEYFIKMGYDVFLVDFLGSGGSEGYQTTIGFYEADQVKACYEFIENESELPVYLYGSSMGAVAIMKAIDKYQITPTSILIECPFGSMRETVKSRFKMMGVPSSPMGDLLLFWGGLMNNFWAYGHNPVEYAKSITVPTLLMYGRNDQKVSLAETETIYDNLKGEKKLKIFEKSGHETFLLEDKEEWVNTVSLFLRK